jgi:SAM-dependent methyltransferase
MNEDAAVRWASGDLYEPYVGRWSRPVAREFLAWLNAPVGMDWLDVGCGTGVVPEAIAQRCAPRRLAGIDPSAGFLDFARQRLKDAGAELYQADARDLPFAAAQFDRVVSGLVLNFVPDQPLALAEMVRVARPGGEVALYVWDYAGKMELMRSFWGDFDDYWSPFLGGQAPAPAYCMSLTEQGRDALRERLRASLPTQADGSIRLVARA